MYYGKMTRELEKLYLEYFKIWGHEPGDCLDVDYDEDEYDEYVADIKKAMEMNVKLPDLFPYSDYDEEED